MADINVDRLGPVEYEFVPTLSVINMLIEEAALGPPDAERIPTKGWAEPVEPTRMLHDDRRTRTTSPRFATQ